MLNERLANKLLEGEAAKRLGPLTSSPPTIITANKSETVAASHFHDAPQPVSWLTIGVTANSRCLSPGEGRRGIQPLKCGSR